MIIGKTPKVITPMFILLMEIPAWLFEIYAMNSIISNDTFAIVIDIAYVIKLM